LPPSQERLKAKTAGVSNELLVYLLSLAVIPLFILILNYYKIYSWIINPFGFVALIYVIYTASKLGKEAFLKLMVALVLIIFSSLFWAFYEQGGGSLNLFAERNVNMNLFGIQLSSAAVNNSITSIFVVLLTPLFVWLWIWLSKRKREPDSVIKFSLGLLQLGLGFYVYVFAAKFAHDGIVSLFFFSLGYFFMVTGELCLSPIGLSAITKLAPAKMVGLMMGMWFLASSYGQYLAGLIGSLMAIPTDTGALSSPAESLPVYTDIFGKIAMVAAACGILLLVLSPVLKKWMKSPVTN
jgi:POT family proton-dependent oligopeptide transporter